MDPLQSAKLAVDAYGPYAFGLLTFVVIIITLVWAALHVWQKAVKPQLDASKQIAAANASAQKDLNQTSSHLLQMQTSMQSSQLEWMRFTRGNCPVCGDPNDNGQHPQPRIS